MQQWQHIWRAWVAKVKTKARKVQDSIRATGGGPAGVELSDIENKNLDIVGTASVHGFTNLEMGIPTSPHNDTPPEILSIAASSEVQEPQQPRPQVASTGPSQRNPVPRRRGMPRALRPPAYGTLLHALEESNSRLEEVMRQSAREIAAAIRDSSAATLRAAEILAEAIASASTLENKINQ